MRGVTQSRGPKSDKRDAYGLAEKLRVGNLDKLGFKAPRQLTRLRELSRTHITLVGDVVRVQARIKSVYRSRGIQSRAQLAPRRAASITAVALTTNV